MQKCSRLTEKVIVQEDAQAKSDNESNLSQFAGLSISHELIDLIADAVANRIVQRILPSLTQQNSCNDEYLTIDELSLLIKKSKQQIYQWVNQSRHGLGEFPYEKAGRSLRFAKKEVIEWMQKNAKH